MFKSVCLNWCVSVAFQIVLDRQYALHKYLLSEWVNKNIAKIKLLFFLVMLSSYIIILS